MIIILFLLRDVMRTVHNVVDLGIDDLGDNAIPKPFHHDWWYRQDDG